MFAERPPRDVGGGGEAAGPGWFQTPLVEGPSGVVAGTPSGGVGGDRRGVGRGKVLDLGGARTIKKKKHKQDQTSTITVICTD